MKTNSFFEGDAMKNYNNGKPLTVWDAVFSDCGNYRYTLWRLWGGGKGMVMFIGLNPSTANADLNDATIRRCMGFAKDWGYSGMFMCNLYSYVSTDPAKLLVSGEPIEENNKWLKDVASNCDKVVFVWGCFKKHTKRMEEVIEMFPNAYCIDKSKDGFPKHPLYLPKKLTVKLFNIF